jgi:hypothetical protein
MERSEIIKESANELERAIIKFPWWFKDPIHAFSIVQEEIGETQKEIIQSKYEPDKSSLNDIKKEAIQSIAMLIRFLENIEKYEF